MNDDLSKRKPLRVRTSAAFSPKTWNKSVPCSVIFEKRRNDNNQKGYESAQHKATNVSFKVFFLFPVYAGKRNALFSKKGSRKQTMKPLSSGTAASALKPGRIPVAENISNP